MPNANDLPGHARSRLCRVFAEHAALSWEKQHALGDTVGDGPWHLNLDDGTISLDEGRLVCPVQLVGTQSPEKNTWLWAWADQASNFPPQLLRSARQLHDTGVANKIAELAQPYFELGSATDRPWFDGHYLAMIACGLCAADGYYRAPSTTLSDKSVAVFALLEAPELRRRVAHDPSCMQTVLMELIFTPWGAYADQKTLVASYARQKGFKVADAGEQMICTGPRGATLIVTFDAGGLITNIKADVLPQGDEPAGPKKAWWRFW
jgi:hypothetical protein